MQCARQVHNDDLTIEPLIVEHNIIVGHSYEYNEQVYISVHMR